MLCQGADVLRPLPQGRHVHHQHVEPVIEVRPEGFLPHHLRKVAVGGGDDAHIAFDDLVAAQTLDLTVFNDPQQLCLQLQRHLADLVEKHGALVRKLEKADFAVLHAAGERAFLIAEHLRFQQGGRQ